MSQPSAFTPLASIDAVVIDTETTGLDARIARIVQLGGIGLTAGVIDRANGFDQLVYPGIPIPPQSTSIHGISDHDVTGKPSFAQVAAAFADFMHDRIVIGHSLDYDFAILQEEYRLAGASWRQPHALDVRVLAQLVSPRLQDHSLDRLCEWLGVEMTARHTAMGDALATAEVYLRLVPHLRHRGIRTFAEAKAAVAAVTERDARTARGLLVVDTPAAFRAPVFLI